MNVSQDISGIINPNFGKDCIIYLFIFNPVIKQCQKHYYFTNFGYYGNTVFMHIHIHVYTSSVVTNYDTKFKVTRLIRALMCFPPGLHFFSIFILTDKDLL